MPANFPVYMFVPCYKNSVIIGVNAMRMEHLADISEPKVPPNEQKNQYIKFSIGLFR